MQPALRPRSRRALAGAVGTFFALAGAPPARAAAPEVEALRAELDATRGELRAAQQELARTRDALGELARRVDALQPAAPAAAAPAAATSGTARLAPVNVDNPAISFVVDAQARSDTKGDGAGFLLGSGELFLSAPIDPFLRAYASINGTSEEGFDLEEAALVTTSLPWNLTVKGGRFFADVGRLSHWHDEALPFVDRPPSLDRIVTGESGAEGVEVSWLAPTEHFFQLTLGAYNSIGSERREEPEEFGIPEGRRSFDELTWLARPLGYLDLGENVGLEVGGTFATVAQAGTRNLYGVDVTLRHHPGTAAFYQGSVLGVEWLWNDERFESERFRRQGGYAYLESFFGRRFSGGVRLDYSEALLDAIDRRRTYSAFFTFRPSEFHRLRLQADQIVGSGPSDQRFTLQWTAFMGSHKHGFATR